MKSLVTHTITAETRFERGQDWCVAIKRGYQSINPMPAEALDQ